MSGARKALKVISVIMIVVAVLNILAGLMVVFGASFVVGQQSASIDGITVDVGTSLQAVGVMAAVSGIVSIIVGILGVRGANRPEKIGPFKVVSCIGLVLCVAQFLMYLATDQMASYGVGGALSLVVQIVIVCLAFKVAAEK